MTIEDKIRKLYNDPQIGLISVNVFHKKINRIWN